MKGLHWRYRLVAALRTGLCPALLPATRPEWESRQIETEDPTVRNTVSFDGEVLDCIESSGLQIVLGQIVFVLID